MHYLRMHGTGLPTSDMMIVNEVVDGSRAERRQGKFEAKPWSGACIRRHGRVQWASSDKLQRCRGKQGPLPLLLRTASCLLIRPCCYCWAEGAAVGGPLSSSSALGSPPPSPLPPGYSSMSVTAACNLQGVHSASIPCASLNSLYRRTG